MKRKTAYLIINPRSGAGGRAGRSVDIETDGLDARKRIYF
jgi:hypothetical protein